MDWAQIMVFRLLPSLALFICILGLVRAIAGLLKAPVPLPMPLTPSAKGRWGRIARWWQDVFILPGLARSRPGHWLQWAALHTCLLLLVLRHLRLILDPVPGFVVVLQPFGSLAGYLLPALLAFRILRRMASPYLARVSRPIDYGVSLLLLLSALSGLFLKLAYRADLWAVKAQLTNMWSFDPSPLPWPGGAFLAHYFWGLAVIVWLPRSPLIHFLAPFFNPIRRMRGDIRQGRHENPWDHEYEQDGSSLPANGGVDPPLRSIVDYQIELRAKQERGTP